MEVSSEVRQVTREKARSRKAKRVWKLKFNINWEAIKSAFRRNTKLHYLSCAPTVKRLSSTIKVHKEVYMSTHPVAQPKIKVRRARKSLEFLLRISQEVNEGKGLTAPASSPRENISMKWREFHGSYNWENLLDPLHPWLRRELIKYGDLAEATYDGFDSDPLSDYYGSCRFNMQKLFQEVGLAKYGYEVTSYIHALSRVDVPDWLEKSNETWSKESNWMGYVAVSNDEESQRIGRRDIVVVWRGTVAPTEWLLDLRTKLEVLDDTKAMVQQGFLTIYKSKDELTRYNKLSASEQVMQEVTRLVNSYKGRGEKVSLTTTGHSLGGALAVLSAYEAAQSFPGLFVSVISFGAPRVGNIDFKEKLNESGVKTLRVVVKQDVVPKLPGWLLNDNVNKLGKIGRRLKSVYRHVGTQLKLDLFASPYLKHESDLKGAHNLQTYLHLLDGFVSKKEKFRSNAKRDLALVNKSTDMLIEDLKVPESWHQLPYKGLVLNKYGRWVRPHREPEDIPCPPCHSTES
ncbi:hypothetical protein K2173_006659 [Erythroxylum novogranatense]|uniref:Fungal lipase-type domain-containing protein n=1 Tax=Erythroxylum novogranatense TaxID=1862640 RepID=A0AAV8T5K0_9ROSI|nr:hypothetical protein K2173_006659 [Erythroxylum novogranatense]